VGGWPFWPFIAQNPKKRPPFQNLIRCTNRAIGAEMPCVLKNAPSQLVEAIAAGGSAGAVVQARNFEVLALHS
jgi:hypothetical protein